MSGTFDVDTSSRFRRQVMALSVLFVLLVAGVTWVVVSQSQRQLIELKALKIAEIVARQAATARSTYAELAVSKLTADGFGAHSFSGGMQGFVPLPSQFLRELSRKSGEHSGGLYRFRPLSLWNLGPDQGIEDDFQRWGWTELVAQDREGPESPIDWRPAWRIEDVDGAPTLRFMRADPASSDSCVGCHNALEQREAVRAVRVAAGVEPGHQWQRNELLGAIEVSVPLAQAAALAREQTRAGSLVVVAVTVIGLAGVCFLFFVDTSRTRAMTRNLSWQARHDALTRLPNRFDFDRRLGALLGGQGAGESAHAVLLLDLDDFKAINDTLGHETGDGVLRIVAERLRGALRDGAFVARLGGDEFAVLLPGADRARAEAIARRLSESIGRPFRIGDHALSSGVSVGIALIPEHGEDAREIMRCADVAMYVAKRSGLPFALYDEGDDENDVSRLSLTADLREALRSESLSLHFQPKFDLAENRMSGAEVLLRWKHPQLGDIGPDVAIPIAERSGLIDELTSWVLTTALSQCRVWREAGFDLRVAVNLSASSLHDAALVERVRTALGRNALGADALILELTESTVMRDPELASRVLRELDEAGIRISIDDFGTGYCSLSYLNRLPACEMKLDRSFVQALFDSDKDEIIVRAALDLAHGLGLRMVAEGVEDARTLRYLREIGCDTVQGYFPACPMPARMFRRRLPALYTLAEGRELEVA